MIRRVLLLLALLLGSTANLAWADQVLVIKSSDLTLYNRAVQGVTSSYRMDRGEVVQVFDLAEAQGADSKLLPERPDVVITIGAAATRFASKRYPLRPIVYCMVVRPDRLDLGAFAQGISMFVPVADMLATLQLVSSNIRHVGVLHAPEHREMIAEAMDNLQGFEATIIPVELKDPRDLPRAARRLVMQTDALWVVPGTVNRLDALQFLLKLSFEHRVPMVGDSPAVVRAGALLSIMPDPVDMGRQAARLAGYLLSGEGLPSERLFYPDMASLAINLKTARAWGIKVPPLLVDFATVTVE
jgi:putative ABC transport system substrate-binding protein